MTKSKSPTSAIKLESRQFLAVYFIAEDIIVRTDLFPQAESSNKVKD